MIKQDVVTYEPDNSLKKGYVSLVAGLVREVWDNRWLTYQLFRRDFSAMYKQSLVGVLWIVILPIINIGVFLMLSRSGIFNIGDINMPYPLYAVIGLAVWQLFATGITACASSLSNAGDMVMRINFSKKSLVMAAMGKPLVSFLVHLALIVTLFIVYKIVPPASVLLLPIIIIPLVLLTLGFGFLVAILNAVVRDIGNLLPVIMTLLMYLTPVLYAKPRIGVLSHLTQYNPVYYFVSGARDLCLGNGIQNTAGFLATVVFSLAVFFVSLFIFHLTETRITERI
jgi:lipopolysaccharide transport system permease protein